ncbi:hypothetical protein ACFW4X_05550 [Streptomyces smyrnaeus]|uniref:hypothetical protein n=1 Tax=Streptomyces smyrnaeus TaxID=1387713 RepID=UPI0033DF6F31
MSSERAEAPEPGGIRTPPTWSDDQDLEAAGRADDRLKWIQRDVRSSWAARAESEG